MWYNSYKWWWLRLGQRPWSYISRDFYHYYPLVVIFILLTIGALLGRFFGMLVFLQTMGIIFIGVLLGHFFWGTSWIPGEKE